MPAVRPGESLKAFVKRAVPILLEEGTAKDRKQAVAIAMSMWRRAQGRR